MAATSKLIAVSGPPGCGKTTLTLKLAQEVHELTKKKVIFVSPDTLIPTMGLVFPKREKESLLSLGAVLENVNLAITDILGVIATTKAMPNLGYMGYIPGEGPYSYAALQEKKVMTFFQILREKFDYVFVDCDRSREDLISSLAIGLCDHYIQIINPDIKSIAYYGFEPLQERSVQVLNVFDNDIYLPIQDAKAHFPNISHTIMYSRAAKMQMVEGEMMDILKDPVYRKALNPIVDMILIKPEPEQEVLPEGLPEENAASLDEMPVGEPAEGENEQLSKPSDDDFWE